MLKIRAHFAHTPAQADTIIKAVRAMYYWGEEVGFVHSVNPSGTNRLHCGRATGIRHGPMRSTPSSVLTGRLARRRDSPAISYSTSAFVSVDLHAMGPQHSAQRLAVLDRRQGQGLRGAQAAGEWEQASPVEGTSRGC